MNVLIFFFCKMHLHLLPDTFITEHINPKGCIILMIPLTWFTILQIYRMKYSFKINLQEGVHIKHGSFPKEFMFSHDDIRWNLGTVYRHS